MPAKTTKAPEHDPKRMDTEPAVLAEQIRYQNQKYWVEHSPEITDIEYDQLIERLRALDPDNPVLIELVEDAAQGFKKVQHAIPMLSIEKVFTTDDVIKWATDAHGFSGDTEINGIVASYKADGSSCSLIYEDGKLVRAASRGNGVLGDDITRNAKTVAGIPHALPGLKGTRVEIRGEIYMSIASFKGALDKFDKLLAVGEVDEEERPVNPRNYCAGSLKQKDPAITKERKLSFIVHGCHGKLPGNDGRSESANVKQLESLGFATTFFTHVRSPAEVPLATSAIEAGRKSLPYEIDGVVFTINKIALHQELGSTSHHPRYRLAFKFGRERGETKVKRILWHTTRSGRVSPAMEVAPISLGGATVTLCTLHNAKTVKETGLHVDDSVLLEREVIPYFVQKMSGSDQPAVLPAQCASCGSSLTWDETETNLVCPNLGGCPSQLHDYLSYYVSRGVTNMVGVGERVISKLLAVGLVKAPVDFYTLTEAQILEKLERQGETSARNIVNSIQSRREQTLETFLVSLGIRGLGPSVAARLVGHFGTLSALQSATPEQLMEVEGIAETMAGGVIKGLQSRKALIESLLKQITLKESEKVEGHLKESFCLTGHVEFDFEGTHYESRPEIEALIKSKGGTIKNVSKKLDYLVLGEGGGGKREKAEKAGVKVVDAAGLVKLLEGGAKAE